MHYDWTKVDFVWVIRIGTSMDVMFKWVYGVSICIIYYTIIRIVRALTELFHFSTFWPNYHQDPQEQF